MFIFVYQEMKILEKVQENIEVMIKEVKALGAKISVVKADSKPEILQAKEIKAKQCKDGIGALETIEEKIMNLKEMTQAVDKKDVVQCVLILIQIKDSYRNQNTN